MTGMEASAVIPLLISGVSTAASMQAAQDAQDERSNILNRQLMKTGEASDKAAALVAREGEEYAPEDRGLALQEQEKQTFEQSQRDLGGDAATIINGAGDAGNVSQEYLTSKADKALTEGQRLTAIARELAKTRAPGQLQQSESIRRAGVAGDLNSMWSGVRAGGRAAGMDAELVEEPAYGAVGRIAGAAASAYQPSGGSPTGSATDYSLTDAQLGQNANTGNWWGGGRKKFGG